MNAPLNIYIKYILQIEDKLFRHGKLTNGGFLSNDGDVPITDGYLSRMELYCKANKVPDDLKVATLLTNIGADIFAKLHFCKVTRLARSRGLRPSHNWKLSLKLILNQRRYE